jgi:hypothetical protein
VKYLGIRAAVLLSAIGAGLLPLPAQSADWKPVRPINLIVPWAAGGSTDQITRLVAGEMEKSLGQTIVIINQPGASGSIGTRSALEATKDGYTWTAGAAQDLGAYQTLGSLDTSIKDWHLFLSVANVQVIGVNPKTPYQNAKELLDAMKAQPGKISVATAGVTSAGHNAMELIAKVDSVKYRHVTYDGGNPAVVATVSGGRAGRHDPRQAASAAGDRQRQGARTRRLRHHPAIVADAPRLLGADQLFRHLHPQGRAGRGDRHGGENLEGEHLQQRSGEEVRDIARRAVCAILGGSRAKGGIPGRAGQCLVVVRYRQGQSVAGYRGHRQALRHPNPRDADVFA